MSVENYCIIEGSAKNTEHKYNDCGDTFFSICDSSLLPYYVKSQKSKYHICSKTLSTEVHFLFENGKLSIPKIDHNLCKYCTFILPHAS